MKTIVSIISEQTIPNFLFIKEMYEEGDRLLFISSQEKRMNDKVVAIQDTLKFWDDVDVIFSEKGDSVLKDKFEEFKSKLSKETEYCVNLTGGTKYMSLYVEKLFSEYNATFYYIPLSKNIIIRMYSDEVFPIKYRVNVDEYMELYGLPIKTGSFCKDNKYSKKLFDFYKTFSNDDHEILKSLQMYRDVKKINIQDIENHCFLKGTKELPQIPSLDDFISSIDFPIETDGWLTKNEIKYITGGWFEEYIYYWVVENIKPNDIKIGVEIKKAKTTNQNDLDVVFTLGNKLFVIECKTGVPKEGLLKEFVYKACSLKEYLLGLSGSSYIFTLSPYKEEFERSAKNMGITYCTKEFLFEKKAKLVDDIRRYADD